MFARIYPRFKGERSPGDDSESVPLLFTRGVLARNCYPRFDRGNVRGASGIVPSDLGIRRAYDFDVPISTCT